MRQVLADPGATYASGFRRPNRLMDMSNEGQSATYNALATFGGPTREAANALISGEPAPDVDWVRYNNKGATRNRPLSSNLVNALSFLPDLGVEMEVFSGGQPGINEGGARVGSTRHDHGHAADVFFYKDGRRLDWRNQEDIPILQEIVRIGRQRGLTGFGAGPGYMTPGSMHVGFGAPAVWGDEGSSANAPDWLRTAYYE